MKQKEINKILTLLAGLCDAMKRLENAVISTNAEERFDYLEECAKRRKAVEDKLIAMVDRE
ncbi:hypothetical protein [Rhizobium phage RHph_X2_24]|nr:hypothetical protein [Rhizobium phage RHph_X2_24]